MDEHTRNFIIRLLNIIALLGAVAWLVSSPDWEPGITALGLLATLLGLEYREFSKRNNDTADLGLFNKFLELLPSNGVIAFVSTFDFGGIFFHERLENIRKFLHTWNDPEHEFLDKSLEKKRKELYQAVEEFMSHIAKNTFVIEDGKQAIPREWEYTQRERFHAAVDAIHASANKVSETHATLVRMARKKLKI